MVANRHRRRNSLRLDVYDYSQAGAYFITSVAYQRQELFGRIEKDECRLTPIGEVVESCWQRLPERFIDVTFDCYVVMPNHFHGIVVIEQDLRGKETLSSIMGFFKYQSTKEINQLQNRPGRQLWQRGYYDHIIRSEKDYQEIYDYILNNPVRWADDRLR